MPRYCKICKEEFPSAAKLAEHLKISSCSNYRTIIKCPYCNRDDFVDEDALNRHLSYNRQCSKADVEATDKLSILRSDGHDPNLIGPRHISYADVIHRYEGNLVNIANSIGISEIHQRQTSLNPTAMKNQQLFVTLSHYSSNMGKEDTGFIDKTFVDITDKKGLSNNPPKGKAQFDIKSCLIKKKHRPYRKRISKMMIVP